MLRHNISLKPYNTLAIEANAAHFIAITQPEQLVELLADPKWRDMPKLILGGGSNILLTHDFPGLIIQMAIKGIEILNENQDHLWLSIGAGENWHRLVCYCVEHHYAGIENLSLIPGTVGAAPIQNIGAYGVEVQQVFTELQAISIQTGALQRFDHGACGFGYRDSIFKRELKNQFIISNVILRLNKQPQFHLDYSGLQQMLDKMGVTQPTLQTVSAAVCKIRQHKLPDPAQIANAGSFFKNPSIPAAQLSGLQQHYPQIPHYAVDPKHYKIPAAWLIEQCGWKGRRYGDVGVYTHHALVLVNYGTGNGSEIWQLANDIQSSVQEKFSISLEPEVNII